jgi:hypothetical protein
MEFWTNLKQVDWRVWLDQARFLRFVPPSYFAFQAWCAKPGEPVGETISFDAFSSDRREGESFPDWVARKRKENEGKWVSVQIDQQWNNHWSKKELRISLDVDQHWNDHWAQEVPVIDGGKIANLEFRPGGDARRHRVFNSEVKNLTDTGCALHIRNCRVDHLTLSNGSDVVIEDCWFRVLECHSNGPSFGRLRIWRGGILDLRLVGEGRFRDAVFVRTWVPRFRLPGETFDVASHRELRAQFTSENDSLAAGVFHAAELSMERPNDPSRMNWLVGLVYELGCDYGNRTFRPVGWLLFVFLVLGAFAFFCDIGVLAMNEKELFGWQKHLHGNGCAPRLLRSAVLAVQALGNPLSLFAKPLVIAKEPWQALVLMSGSVVGILAIAMFFISVRRRFRLE